MMNEEQTVQFAAAIQERRVVMADILRWTLQQQEAIESGLVERLLEVLREKELLVDQLRTLQQRLQPWAGVSPESRQWTSTSAREECRRAVEETERLQQAILAVDARCEQAMVQRRDELFQTIQHTTGAAAIAKMYADAGKTSQPGSQSGATIDFTSG